MTYAILSPVKTFSLNNSSTHSIIILKLFITAGKRNLGKVMFSQACVCPHRGRGIEVIREITWQGLPPPGQGTWIPPSPQTCDLDTLPLP